MATKTGKSSRTPDQWTTFRLRERAVMAFLEAQP
jgi:hypothetical protein